MAVQGGETVKEYLVGAGGWAYFRVPGIKPLTAYSRIFNFVEVNSTFYQMPPLKKVEEWRRLVPSDFEFSVRAHQSITHKYRLQPVKETFEALDYMKKICSELKADVMHIQFPPSFELSDTSIINLRNLILSANLQKLRVALEIRGLRTSRLPTKLLKTMLEFNIIHCVDLSRGEIPAYESEILYTRLFGKGHHNVYQPTDDELRKIDERATDQKPEKIIMSFHFVRMYKDAARLKVYKQSGTFPRVTKSMGLASLEEVLSEDVTFPSTKQELMRSQGWKIFDLSKTERVHAEELLKKLPEGTFTNLTEVIDVLRHEVGG